MFDVVVKPGGLNVLVKMMQHIVWSMHVNSNIWQFLRVCEGTCKHVIAKAGANFVRTGERYGYAFYLQVMEFGEGLQFLHLDINCLHTHWRKLAVAAVQNSTDQIVLNHPARAAILQHHRESANLIPLVSEMHVKTHDFACQVSISLFTPTHPLAHPP